MKDFLKDLRRKDHPRYLGGMDFLKYVGPGLLVTVGFIDPGNWASNFAAGSMFGYFSSFYKLDFIAFVMLITPVDSYFLICQLMGFCACVTISNNWNCKCDCYNKDDNSNNGIF